MIVILLDESETILHQNYKSKRYKKIRLEIVEIFYRTPLTDYIANVINTRFKPGVFLFIRKMQ